MSNAGGPSERAEGERTNRHVHLLMGMGSADATGLVRALGGLPVSEAGRITEDGVARLRARIGVPEPHPMPPHYREPNTDAFRNVAIAYGDDNPLWCDPDYADGTRGVGRSPRRCWSAATRSIGEDEVTEVADEHQALMKGDPLRGVHAFYARQRPRVVGAAAARAAACARRNALVGVLDKPSEFAERAVHEWTGQVFRDDDGPCCRASTG